MNAVEQAASDAAEERILDALLRPARPNLATQDSETDSEDSEEEKRSTRQIFRKKLREGKLDDKEIDIDITGGSVGVEIMAPPGMEEMTSQLQNMFSSMSTGKKRSKRMKIKDALKVVNEEEASKLINEDELKHNAIEAIEENGIVFIDEIDKVAKRGDHGGTDVSREGVQRDLLPLIEGSTVSTKYGMVKTDHILFIASGAFHLSKPSDLIPELQGRLPIRVELQPLTPQDFERILTEPNASLTEQYQALLKTEGLALAFCESGVKRIAEVAWQVNEKVENIGARRLHTVLERLLENVSFEADQLVAKQEGDEEAKVKIDEQYVNEHIGDLAEDEDLSRYIL